LTQTCNIKGSIDLFRGAYQTLQ